MTKQRHWQYWAETQNGQTRVTSSIDIRHIMDKPETQAFLGQDTEWTNQTYAALRHGTEWTNQRHRQHWVKTQNGQTRDTCSIKTSHKMDKPETQAVLRQDTEWTSQRQRQY